MFFDILRNFFRNFLINFVDFILFLIAKKSRLDLGKEICCCCPFSRAFCI